MSVLVNLFSYPFLVRALIVGVMVSLCSAMLGVSLVLKRYSMIGDGLSHVSFGALAIAAALALPPLAVSIPLVILAAFFLLRMSEHTALKGDAAIALFASSALAIGIIVTSLSTGITTDVCNYMFGSILALSDGDAILSIVLSIVVLLLYMLFYNKIFAVTFDEAFSRATGVNVSMYNMLIALLTAVTIVLGMRIMGALLISSLIIFPALSAMRVCRSYKGVIIFSALFSIVCFTVGIVASCLFSTPVGASVVMVDLAVFAVCCLTARIRARLAH